MGDLGFSILCSCQPEAPTQSPQVACTRGSSPSAALTQHFLLSGMNVPACSWSPWPVVGGFSSGPEEVPPPPGLSFLSGTPPMGLHLLQWEGMS